MTGRGGSLLTYRSTFTGRPAMVTVPHRKSENGKTGAMVQVYFLAKKEEPHRAQKTGEDETVCGDCGQRRHRGGPCYVRTCNDPLACYRAVVRGSYGPVVPSTRPVRIGAYGDPASMPPRRFGLLMQRLDPAGHTGYTHHWRRAPHLQRWTMASVESVREGREARRAGWRYFRIRRPGTATVKGEIRCPALASGGRVKCIECLLCSGTSRRGPDVVADVHGHLAGRFTERRKA